MQVILFNNIFSNIVKAIRNAETANDVIDYIKVSRVEMAQLTTIQRAKEPADDHYGSELNEWKIHNIGPAFPDTNIPTFCWIKNVKIVSD